MCEKITRYCSSLLKLSIIYNPYFPKVEMNIMGIKDTCKVLELSDIFITGDRSENRPINLVGTVQ